VLCRAGISLLRAGLHTSAAIYWHRIASDSVRLLGDEHRSTINARANLASSYWQAGRTTEAITILEKVVDDSVRLLGGEHPDTVAAIDALQARRARTSCARQRGTDRTTAPPLRAAVPPSPQHLPSHPSRDQPATRSRCRIGLFWIKAPRKRGAPGALATALLAALGRRHRAPRRAAPTRRVDPPTATRP
jgi:hypothetical protein